MWCDMYCNIFKGDFNDLPLISLTIGLMLYRKTCMNQIHLILSREISSSCWNRFSHLKLYIQCGFSSTNLDSEP